MFDAKTRIHNLKLALLREGGDYRYDAGTRMSCIYNLHLQEVGTILQYVEKENGNNKDCHLVVEIKKDDGNIKYAVISSDCVIGKADPNKSVHC